jgi:hypothetical protein
MIDNEVDEAVKEFGRVFAETARVYFRPDGGGSIFLGISVWQNFDDRAECLEILNRWNKGPSLA